MGSSSTCCSKISSRSSSPIKNNKLEKKNSENYDSKIYYNRQTSLMEEGTLTSREMRCTINSTNESSNLRENILVIKENSINLKKKIVCKSIQSKLNYKDIIKGELKGKGKFGSVYSGLNSITGKKYALKFLENVSSEKKLLILNSQNDIIKHHHQNLIKTYKIEEDNQNKNNLIIINEFCGGSSLHNLINSFGNLNEDLIKIYTKQILHALEFLHSKGIYHKNLTSKNIFIDSNGHIKISDFLIDAILFGDGKEIYSNLIDENYKGNINYYIPYYFINDIINDNNFEINQSFDLFCLGCIIIELSTGKFPWVINYFNSQKDYINYLIKNKSSSPSIPSFLSKQLKDFIQLLFNKNETSKKNIYQKIYNLDFMISPIKEEISSKSKIFSVNGSSFTNSYLNNNENLNYGQILQKNKVINLFNKNENPSFSISCSDPSSITNSKINSILQNEIELLRRKKNNSKNLSGFGSVGIKENISLEEIENTQKNIFMNKNENSTLPIINVV